MGELPTDEQIVAADEALCGERGPKTTGVCCPACGGDGDDPWREGGDCLLCAGTGEVTGERLVGLARHLSSVIAENKRHAVVIRAAYAVLNDYAGGAESHYARPGSSRCHCCGRKWPCNWHRLGEVLRRARPVAPVDGC